MNKIKRIVAMAGLTGICASSGWASDSTLEITESMSKKNAKKISKLTECAVALIEAQNNGTESIQTGLNYFAAITSNPFNSTHLKSSIQSCKKDLQSLDTSNNRGITKAEWKEFETQNLSAYSQEESETFRSILDRSVNRYLHCTRLNSFHMGAALLVGFNVGYQRVSCDTPLGRKYKYRGPAAGMTLGAGLTFDILPSGKNVKISEMPLIPAHRLPENFEHIRSFYSAAMLAGINSEYRHPVPNDKIGASFGFGYTGSVVVGKGYRKQLESNFSYLYRQLGQLQPALKDLAGY